MRLTGWKPGQPLGKLANGILRPITLKGQIGRTGLGYKNVEKHISGLIEKRFNLLSVQTMIEDRNLNTVFDEDQREREYFQGMRPDIPVTCEGHKIIALLDTGSDITCISEDLFNKLKSLNEKLPVIPVKGFQIRGAVGQRSSKINSQVNLTIQFAPELEMDIPFLIVPGLARAMILGFDFIKQHKLTLHIEKLGIEIEHDKKSFFIAFKDFNEVMIVGKEDCANQKDIEKTSLGSFEEEVKIGCDIGELGKAKLLGLLKKYERLFSMKLGRANCYEHKITMQDDKPIVNRSYPIPYAYKDKMEEKLNEMEEMGIITRASTPYSSPLTFALKKDGRIRVLLDARGINKHMVAETEKPPMQIDVLNSFHGANFITTIDLNNAYFQIPINEEGKKYTGFTFNGKSYVYNVLPQGLKTSVGSFSRAMDTILGPDVREFCVNYLDDLAIITTGPLEVHLEHIERVLQKLYQAGLTCNLQKCEFICKEVKMLGFIISTEGIRTDPDKIKSIREFPVPRKVKQVRAFLGLCNFYRRFIPRYNESIQPLCELLKKGKRWHWGVEEQKAFEGLKDRFIETIMLHHPNFAKPYYIQTDCSGIGLAGVLYQYDDGGQLKILGFHSKALKGAELNWTTTEQEFYAVISTIKKFETYLRGSKVYIRTDHKALLFIQNMKLYNGRVTRWILYLEQFNYEIEHVTGKMNIVADILSRYLPNSEIIQEEKAICPEIAYLEKSSNKVVNQGLRNISALQEHDPVASRIMKDIRNENNQCVSRLSSRCFIKENKLYMKVAGREVLVLPNSLVDSVIKQVHEEMGHQGAYKVIKYVKERFYWPNLSRDVKKIVNKCHICQLSKCNNFKYFGPCQPIVTQDIGDLVMADIYGPLPKGTFGYQYILVVQDSFCKFVKLYPMRRATAQSVVTKIKQFIEIIKPKAIMTDNGSQFISHLWKDSLHALGIKTIYTTVRNPRPNSTERVNKELGRMFRTFCHNNHKGWASRLGDIEKLYNNTKHDSTGFTPCEVMYGKSSKMSFDKYLKLQKKRLNVQEIREQVRNNLKEQSELRRNKYNSRHKLVTFHIGDLVKIKRVTQSHAESKQISKFDLLYEGPYRVVAIPFDNVYVLEDPETGVVRGKFNAMHLSKYYK